MERELSTAEWKTVIDRAWQAGIPHVVFTGGEPTLRDDLPELIAHAESNGQVSGLLSDGLRLADPAYLDSLLKTGLDHVMIVLQPADDSAWNALDNVIAGDIFAAVHLTLDEKNVENMPALLEKLAQRGVRAISLSADQSELSEPLSKMRDLAAALSLELVWDLPVPYSALNPIWLEVKEYNPAAIGKRAVLYVEPDGDVLPTQGDNRLLGNVLKDGWDFLWKQKLALP